MCIKPFWNESHVKHAPGRVQQATFVSTG